MIWASIVFGGLSAISWLLAAVIPPAVVGSYWNGPPKHISLRLRLGAAFNAGGAFLAALAMAFQAYATWSALP